MKLVDESTDFIRIDGVRVSVISKLAKEGACLDSDPDLFFPDGEGELTIFESNREAKKICAGCPVALLCLDYAVATGQYGTWGGATMRERKHLKTDDERSDYIMFLRDSRGETDLDFDFDDDDEDNL